ncbi:MAG: hypothetical protein QM811_26495 [Pirellulales bacterium]
MSESLEPESPLRCVVCGAATLLDLGEQRGELLSYTPDNPARNALGLRPIHVLSPARLRTCATCGHVSVFVDPRVIANQRAQDDARR